MKLGLSLHGTKPQGGEDKKDFIISSFPRVKKR